MFVDRIYQLRAFDIRHNPARLAVRIGILHNLRCSDPDLATGSTCRKETRPYANVKGWAPSINNRYLEKEVEY